MAIYKSWMLYLVFCSYVVVVISSVNGYFVTNTLKHTTTLTRIVVSCHGGGAKRLNRGES